MEIPAPDPKKLLQCWMEWERGESTPGRVLSNLKTAGMREFLEDLAAQAPAPEPGPEQAAAAAGAGPEVVANWTPIV